MTADDLSPGAARRERPAGPELARIHDALFDARHEEADVEWADRAFVHMGFAAVRLDQVELLLSEGAAAVRASQEGPTGLSPGFAVLPLLIAAALMLLITVFKRATPRFRFPVVIALCAGTVVLASAGIAGILAPLAQSDLEAGWLWTILLVPPYAVLAWTIATLWRARRIPPRRR